MSLLYAIQHPRFNTVVREISIVPLEVGAGCVVAFELHERTNANKRRVVAVAANEHLAPVRTLLETGWNERLIGAAPLQAAHRAVLLGMRYDVDVETQTLLERSCIRGLHPAEGQSDPFFFLERPSGAISWPGRIEEAQYRALAVGGRWVTGTSLLVVAERRTSIPDGDEVALVALAVDSQHAFRVQGEVVIDSQIVTFWSGGSPYANVMCTRAAMGNSGWMVAWKSGNRIFRSVINDLIATASGPIVMWEPPASGTDAGNTLEEFRIDGQPGNGQTYGLAMVHRLPGSGDRIARVRVWTPSAWSPGLVGDNQLGGTFGNLRLACDTTTDSHFLLIHQPSPVVGEPAARFCRIGYTAAVHERYDLRVNRDHNLNRTFPAGTGVEHDRYNDRVLIASLQDEGEQWGVTLRADGRGTLMAFRQGSASCAQIGSEYQRRTGGPISRIPIAGSRKYEIELENAPPSTEVTLHISTRLTGAVEPTCTPVVDATAGGAVQRRARTDAAGRCDLRIPLSEFTFPLLFDTTEDDYRLRGEQLDYPRLLFAQWTWVEVRLQAGSIDPTTGERRSPTVERIQRASNVLTIVVGT